MQDGYQKTVLIVVLGFSYIGATYAVTGHFMKLAETKPITNFHECYWRELQRHDFSTLSEFHKEKAVVDTIISCNNRFNKNEPH